MAGGQAFDRTQLLGGGAQEIAPFQRGDRVTVLKETQAKGKTAVVIDPLFKHDTAKVEMDEKDARGQIKTFLHSELELMKQQAKKDITEVLFEKGVKVRILKESRLKGKLAIVAETAYRGRNAMVKVVVDDPDSKYHGDEKSFLSAEVEAAGRQAVNAPGVRVFVRLRPPEDENDVEFEGFKMFEFDDETRPGRVTIKDPLSAGRSEHTYEFNSVFQQDQKQECLFAPLAVPTIDAAIDGISGCIVAYGQTGSGKTYSIFGEKTTGSSRGLLPRTFERLFDKLKDQALQDETTLLMPTSMSLPSGSLAPAPPTVAVSFLEVYLDRIRDLGRFSVEDSLVSGASPSRSSKGRPPPSKGMLLGTANTSLATSGGGPDSGSLDIREGPSGTVHIQGLTRLPVTDFSDAQHVIERGMSGRAIGQTAGNERSSRSHAIFTVYIPKPPDPNKAPKAAIDETEDDLSDITTLSFVDLAGSERLAKTKADGVRFQEGVSINSALAALGKVVLALTKDDSSLRHVPYRDSKLTRILSPSFGDGANLVILATVHPRVEDYAETLNTLSWADGCKNMQREPTVTYISQKKCADMRIKDLQGQIVKLKERIAEEQQAVAKQMSNCGVTGIGGFGKVDEVDMEIAKVLMHDSIDTSKLEPDTTVKISALADTKESAVPNASGGKRDSKANIPPQLPRNIISDEEKRQKREETARDRSIAALVALQEERGRQSDANDKAEQRMQILEKERSLLQEVESSRQEVREVLLKRGQELEAEQERVQNKLQQALESQGEDHDKALQALTSNSETRLQQADEPLLRINAQLAMMKEITETKREGWEQAHQLAEKEYTRGVRKIKEDHAKHLKELKVHWQARLTEKEAINEKYMGELVEHQKSHEQVVAKCQDELLSLYLIILKLAKLTSDIEDGKHPFVWRDGLKEVVLPTGARPTLPTEEAHPQLFDAVAADNMISPLERMQQPPSSGRRGRTGSGGIAAVAAAEAIRKSSEGAAMDSTMRPRDAPAPVEAFCRAEDEIKAESILSNLSVDHLRRLCVELRDQSVGLFAPGEEREALRRTALAALEDGSTDVYIRDLEQRRCSEQAALSDAVDRGLQLRSYLGSRKSSHAATTPEGVSRPQTPTGGKSGSRPITPSGGRSHPSSRAGSRPTTAENSRPPPHRTYLPQGIH